MATFYRQNAWWLATGAMLTFGSSFGQTFFISLFAGVFRDDYGLSNGEWGGLYTLATLASAACLVQFGRLADTVPLARLAAAVIVLYTVSALVMMASVNVVMLGLAVFGLRFCGQGMMSHMAMTAMARWFNANRARAIAVAVLGFPIGEALFPLVTVGFVEAFGWRTAWAVVAALLAGLFLPAAILLLRQGRTPRGEGTEVEVSGMEGRQWTRAEVLRHWSFWTMVPAVLASPFIGTCVFFHQVHIAEVRGYDIAVMAAGYPLYAALSVAASLLSGPIIDRLGATRVLPVLLGPVTIGIALLAVPGGVGIWFAVLAGIAINQGVAVTILGTLWPTLYGTRWIGSIKALVSAAMVLSTAIGPGITGWLIDAGIAFPDQALGLAGYCLAISVVLTLLAPRLAGKLAPAGRAQPA